MATKVAKKPRSNKLQINVTHVLFGPGQLVERRATPSGNDILVVRFPDETRSLLAASRYWLSLPDLAAIPVAKKSAGAVKFNREPEIEQDDVEADVELECVA